MAFVAESHNATAASPLVITNPGIADDNIIVITATVDASAATFTWPAGFTEITGSPISTTFDGMTVGAAIKKAASESGNYSITPSAGVAIGGLVVFSGRDTTNYNHRTGTGTSNSGNASVWNMTSGAFGGGNTSGTCDIVMIGSSDEFLSQSVNHGPPGGYTEAFDIEAATEHIALAYKEAQASGFDGVLTMTGDSHTPSANQAAWGVFVIALLAAAGGGGGGNALWLYRA